MPIKQAIWKVGAKPTPLAPSSLTDEKLLENMIETDPLILAEEWLIIGRQVQTAFGGYVDLLAIAPDGSLVVIELKRHKTPREVVAQAIDYASWVETLEADTISNIYGKYSLGGSLDEAFLARFNIELQEENLNQTHQIVIVAAELDPSTERIISFLAARDIAVNAVFFEVFSNGTDQFLVRRWFVDPAEIQSAQASTSTSKEPWNGEFYVSFGDDGQRSWEDARKYGFISAGGGQWYSRTLNLLKVGDRVWVRIPKFGYVGVGIVESAPIPVREFEVEENGESMPILEINSLAKYRTKAGGDDQEYFVKVRWIYTLPKESAYDELGFFGNQNSVCKPTASKWRSTVEHLKTKFEVD